MACDASFAQFVVHHVGGAGTITLLCLQTPM